MRGRLHADLDPLRLKADDPAELDPATGFTEADYGRKIFIDNYLGLEYAAVPEMLAILRRTYCRAIGVEYMHLDQRRGLDQERMEGGQKSSSRPERRRSSTSWWNPRASRSSSTSSIPAPSAWLDGSEATSRR